MTGPWKKIVTYLAITFGLSSIFYGLIISAGSLNGSGGLYVIGLMWCPGVAALITQYIYTRSLRGLGWGWGKTKYQVWAYLTPLGYSAAAYIIVWVFGLGGFPDAEKAAKIASGIGFGDTSLALQMVSWFLYVACV